MLIAHADARTAAPKNLVKPFFFSILRSSDRVKNNTSAPQMRCRSDARLQGDVLTPGCIQDLSDEGLCRPNGARVFDAKLPRAYARGYPILPPSATSIREFLCLAGSMRVTTFSGPWGSKEQHLWAADALRG